MKLSIRLAFISLLTLVVLGSALTAVIKERPTAQSTPLGILVTWKTGDESGVQRFEVLRRVGWIGDFVVIGVVDQLTGDNSTYEFLDRDAFKTADRLYQYKIRIINGQNPAPESEIVSVSHVSSAAKRTWGSIKAMFR